MLKPLARGQAAVLTTALLLTGAAAIAGCAGTPAALLRTGADAARTSSTAAAHRASLSAAGQRQATLAVVSGAAAVTVSAAAMPGTLLRVWTPANSGIRPQLVSSAGRVQLFLDSTGQAGPSAVSIQLSTAVTWQLQFSGGASQTVLQLGNGKVAGLDFTAGSSLIQMTLPRPSGTREITLAGGASQVTLTVPAGVPTRLRLAGGASTATLAGAMHVGLPGGTVLSTAGWAQATDRYDVDAPAGVSDISVSG